MDILLTIVGLIVTYLVGTKWVEKRHYASIREREEKLLSLPVVSLKSLGATNASRVWVVTGSVVISSDFFKRFMAGLIQIFGGRVGVYETLLDRARRESVLRMKEQAIREGASTIVNVRVETSSINKNDRNGKIGATEILTYGTALRIAQ